MLIALLSLAFAQQEACDPKPASALEAELDKAIPALSEDPATAKRGLETAGELARCLATPIEAKELARYAWARAELATLEQDEEAVWAWSTLARDAGAPEPPASVPPRHPLRELLLEAPEPPPVAGPDDVDLAPPKKGTIYADGKPLTEPVLRLETPHLVQVFERDQHYLGYWLHGSAFPKLLLAARGVDTRPSEDAHDAVPPANWKPAKLGTEEAYAAWVKKHGPDGPWVQEAENAIDELHWEAAKATNTDLAFRQYLYDFPEGLHRREASFNVEHHAYTEVMGQPTRERWETFLERFPEGTYANEAHVQIENIDWRSAQKANTPSSYAAFQKAYPKGRNIERARLKEEERTFEKAAQVLSITGLNAYLERWPEGQFVEEAKALRGDVQLADVVIEVTGDLTADELDAIRGKLVEIMEKRKLPIAETPSSSTGRLTVDAWAQPGGQFLRLRADVALDYGELKRPLITLTIDSPILKSADKGAKLAEMMEASLPTFELWHTPPEDPKKPAE